MVRRIYQCPDHVCIVESAGGDPALDAGPRFTPLDHLEDIYWHSSLGYVVIAYDQSMTVNMPARGFPPGNQKYYFADHNLGFEPFGVLIVGTAQLPTGEPVQGATAAARHVVLGVDSTRVWLMEAWNYNSLAAYNQTYRAILVKPAPTTTSPHRLEERPTRVIYGGGKFDTDNDYLRSSPVSPDFFMTRGRTIDTVNGGYKGLRPDGTFQTFNTYTGSFAGIGFFGVAD